LIRSAKIIIVIYFKYGMKTTAQSMDDCIDNTALYVFAPQQVSRITELFLLCAPHIVNVRIYPNEGMLGIKISRSIFEYILFIVGRF